MVSSLDFGLNVLVRLPPSWEWRKNQSANKVDICIYVQWRVQDGLRKCMSLFRGLFRSFGVNRPMRLANLASIFQDEVPAKKEQ